MSLLPDEISLTLAHRAITAQPLREEGSHVTDGFKAVCNVGALVPASAVL